MAARRAEDAAALAILDARPIWLDFRDDQYGDPPEINELADALERQIRDIGAREIFIPMGLFHNDHKRVHAAALLVFNRHPEFYWYAYEEPNYRLVPNLRDERLASLADAGICAQDHASPVNEASEVKHRAVHAYCSQLRALATPGRPGLDDVFAPERYWRFEQRIITGTDQNAG
jgi:LmbE family N-acetylglucosaminyl deacetylase